jgi:glucose-6-phosphate isomerase
MSNNALALKHPVKSAAVWEKLAHHAKQFSGDHAQYTLQSLFASNPNRGREMVFSCDNISFDASKNLITQDTLDLLFALAESSGLKEKIEGLFTGEILNTTENRPALHTALRSDHSQNSSTKALTVNGTDIFAAIRETRAQMKAFTEKFHHEKQFTDIVHIGIGGSDFGPQLVCRSLSHLAKAGLKTHFLSNIDPDAFHEVISRISLEKSLFIIASKSFTTQETITNAHSVKALFLSQFGKDYDFGRHFCAVTGKHQAARDFGVPDTQIFDLPDWVGGRFSLWSAVGLPIALTLGYKNFSALLEGAAQADAHFRSTDFTQNLSVLMALIGIWNRNFLDYSGLCVLPYAHRLALFPNFIQQLDMESNGKSVDLEGKAIEYATTPLVFGGIGTLAQHTFFQFLHQSQDIVPCDFIAIGEPLAQYGDHHEKLIANVLGQTKALMEGRINISETHKNFSGNRPSNLIWLDQLTPQALGALIAIYEHKIFTQGVIWNINSFDQFGVELGKELATEALKNMA